MRCYLILFFTLSGIGWAFAHPMPNSVVNLFILDNTIKGVAKMPLLELQSAMKLDSIPDINNSFFDDYFTQHIAAVSDPVNWKTKIVSLDVITDHDPMIGDYQEVVVHFELIPDSNTHLRHFTFDYSAIIHQVVTHQIFVFLQYDWKNGIQEESASQPIGVIRVDVPTGKILPLKVDLKEGSWRNGFTGMFLLGMKHINAGLDHILFLLTLLLIAPLAVLHNKWSGYQGMRYTWTRFLQISLAFTLGHSITLIAGSFNIITFRIQYIEILIAITIILSAMNCIKPVFSRREVLIASTFGLIHGLAFSMSLSHLDLGVRSKLISIIGFNLGIEAMQLIIMICFIPVLLISQWKMYWALRIAFALFTMVISAAWLMERIVNHENLITKYMNSLL